MTKVEKQLTNFTWIIYESPKEDVLTSLFSEYNIENIEVDSILKQDSRVKLDVYKGEYNYLKLNFLKYSKTSDSFKINELHNIIGQNYLITISTYSSRKLHSIIKKYDTETFTGTVEDLLYEILDKQVSKGSRIVDYIEEEIQTIEKGVYDKINKDIIKTMSKKRKNITVLKHNLNLNISVLESLSKIITLKDSDLGIDYDYLVDKAHKSYQECLILEETIDGVDTTVKSLFEVQSNDIIKKVTIVSVIFLPLNLIAGIFGMNIVEVPFQGTTVLTIFIGTIIVMLLGLYLLKKYIYD